MPHLAFTPRAGATGPQLNGSRLPDGLDHLSWPLRRLPLHRSRPRLPLHVPTQAPGPPEAQHTSGAWHRPTAAPAKAPGGVLPGPGSQRGLSLPPLCRFSGSQHCGHIHCAYQYREHYHCLDPECNYQVMPVGARLPALLLLLLLQQQQKSRSEVGWGAQFCLGHLNLTRAGRNPRKTTSLSTRHVVGPGAIRIPVIGIPAPVR